MTTVATPRPTYLLPAEAYYSQEWYDREQKDLFGRTWNLVAYTCDVPAPGDTVPVTVAGRAVVLTRAADGSVQGATDTGAPVAVGTWAGLVFVHLDPAQADGFRAWLGDYPTPEFVGEYPWDDLVEIGRVSWDLACNWKLYIENHIDCYHLWYLHDESLGMFDHSLLTYRSSGRHWACVEPERPGTEPRRQSLPAIPGVTEDEMSVVRANLLFPNVPWSSSRNLVNTYQVVPTGPETCRLDLRMRAAPGAVLTDEVRAANAKVLYDEDGFACEQMQRVVRSPRFEVGPLATVHEQPIAQFHAHVLEALR